MDTPLLIENGTIVTMNDECYLPANAGLGFTLAPNLNRTRHANVWKRNEQIPHVVRNLSLT